MSCTVYYTTVVVCDSRREVPDGVFLAASVVIEDGVIVKNRYGAVEARK